MSLKQQCNTFYQWIPWHIYVFFLYLGVLLGGMVGNVGSEVVDLVIRSMSNALSISISKHLHSKVVVTAKVEFNLIAIIMESFSI